jgi:xeroderma pigmentosum group C-complementing protein
MVPSGGHHVPHSLAKKAAQILNIDYADAVTGFQFKGRHGTAITSGVVVAEEYHEAVEAVIEGFKHVQENEEARLYSLECLKLWRRFLAGLRIKMRLSEYTTTGPKDIEPATVKAKMDEAEDAQDEIVEAGGFFPDQGEITAPTAHQFKRRRSAESEHEDGDIAESAPRLRRQRKTIVESDQESDEQSEEEYILPSPQKPPTRRRRLMLSESPPAVEDGLEDMENAGGFLPDADADADNLGGGFVPDADADGFGGGFMPENNDAEATHESGGGFMPEPDNEENTYESDGGFVPEEDDPALNSGGGFMPARDDQPEDTDGGFLPTCNTLGTQSPVQQAPEDINMDRETETINRNLEEEKQLDDTFDPDNMDDDTFDPDEMDTGISNKVLARESSTGAHMQKKDDADDDDGDRGSLLSHDPDDEDAEPEWLYSD